MRRFWPTEGADARIEEEENRARSVAERETMRRRPSQDVEGDQPERSPVDQPLLQLVQETKRHLHTLIKIEEGEEAEGEVEEVVRGLMGPLHSSHNAPGSKSTKTE